MEYLPIVVIVLLFTFLKCFRIEGLTPKVKSETEKKNLTTVEKKLASAVKNAKVKKYDTEAKKLADVIKKINETKKLADEKKKSDEIKHSKDLIEKEKLADSIQRKEDVRKKLEKQSAALLESKVPPGTKPSSLPPELQPDNVRPSVSSEIETPRY